MSKHFSSADERFMRLAVKEALKGSPPRRDVPRGRVSPGPLVGAIVVKAGKVIGRGFYAYDGAKHAEFVALGGLKKTAGKSRKFAGATVYVTLEPCVAFVGKRTIPCCDVLLESGVRRVVVAMKDVDKRVCGKGVAALRRAGVRVDVGLLKDEAMRMNEFYVKRVSMGMPFVTLKMGMTLDGRIAMKSGESRYISGEESRGAVHEMRSLYDAVMTSAETVLRDDPHLGVRGRELKRRDPLRVVVDRRGRVPKKAQVFRDENVRVFKGMDVKEVLEVLGRDGVSSVLVEAGGGFAAALLKEQLVDRCVFFIAPKFIGAEGVAVVGDLGLKALSDVLKLKNVRSWMCGDDIVVEGSPVYD